ncbi:MAG: glycosyltransferase [Planctomycetaceae bacterium]
MTSPAPSRLAFVITELDPGGAEQALCELVTRLDPEEFVPRVFTLRSGGALVDLLRARQIEVVELGARHRFDLGVVSRLARALREFQPDLVQTWLWHANVAGAWAAARAGVPRLVSGIRVAERRGRWRHLVDRGLAGRFDRQVCVSRGVADQARLEVGLPAERLRVIPNGVDPGRFDTAPVVDWQALGLPAGAQVLLSVGRLEAQKGPQDLWASAEIVARQVPDVHWVWVGEGPLRESLEREADRLGLATRLHLVGRRDDVPALMRGACGLVLSSRWEGMPNVVLEALAARCPVIATRVEGIAELIEPGQTGWVCPPQDPAGLATAQIELLRDAEQGRRLGEAGRRRVEERFTWDRMAAQYESLYLELLGRPTA